jgi:hypothetical protein
MAVELAGNVYPIVVNARRNKETLGPFASPSALAVLRLTASSNLTGWSKWRSLRRAGQRHSRDKEMIGLPIEFERSADVNSKSGADCFKILPGASDPGVDHPQI